MTPYVFFPSLFLFYLLLRAAGAKQKAHADHPSQKVLRRGGAARGQEAPQAQGAGSTGDHFVRCRSSCDDADGQYNTDHSQSCVCFTSSCCCRRRRRRCCNHSRRARSRARNRARCSGPCDCCARASSPVTHNPGCSRDRSARNRVASASASVSGTCYCAICSGCPVGAYPVPALDVPAHSREHVVVTCLVALDHLQPWRTPVRFHSPSCLLHDLPQLGLNHADRGTSRTWTTSRHRPLADAQEKAAAAGCRWRAAAPATQKGASSLRIQEGGCDRCCERCCCGRCHCRRPPYSAASIAYVPCSQGNQNQLTMPKLAANFMK